MIWVQSALDCIQMCILGWDYGLYRYGANTKFRFWLALKLINIASAIRSETWITFPVAPEAPVTQLAKRWPIELAVPFRALFEAKIFSTANGVALHTVNHYHPPNILI